MGDDEMQRALSSWTSIPLRCCLGMLAIFVVLNLPFRYTEQGASSVGEASDMRRALVFSPASASGKVLAGWPLRYAAWTPDAQGQWVFSSSRLWSLRALVVNVAIALTAAAVALIAGCYPRAGLVSVAGTVAAFAGWGVHHTTRDLAAARTLAASGTVHRSALVPVGINHVLPGFVVQACARTRGVMLRRLDDEVVAQVAQLPTLHSLGFYEHAPEPAQLQAMLGAGRLEQLAFHQIPLNDALLRLVATQHQLLHLEMVGCRGLAGGFPQLQQLANLHTLSVVDSEFPLSTLAGMDWGNRLRHLAVSHERPGNEQLVLHHYRNLETLNIQKSSKPHDVNSLELSLAVVPQLQLIRISDRHQVALSIAHAPHLTEVQLDQSEVFYADLAPEVSPLHLWLTKLHLMGVPSLRKISCYGLDLESVEIQAAPHLTELVIAASYRERGALGHRAAANPEQISRLIDDLADCSGPPVIDLQGLPLEGVDLTPLTKNQRIRELRLAGTGIDSEQLATLLALPRLQGLDLRGCPIHSEMATEALRVKPALRQLQIEARQVEHLELVDRPHLVQYTSGPNPDTVTVLIAGAPRLSSELILGNALESLWIEDANSLRGLSVNGLVPPGATLKGLRDLQFCALGGPNVDDRLCDSLWDCAELKHLTLAYANVTRKALVNIGRLEHLTTLMLPGCDVDDSVTHYWAHLRHLRVIDLSHTRISTGTFDQLLVLRNLQRLALNYVDLDKSDLIGLERVMQLFELEVAGIGLEDDALRALVERGMLDRLDLSDCTLSPAALRILSQADSGGLVYLGLRNCGLGEPEIRAILAARPSLAVDIEGNPLSADFREELRRTDRLLSHADRAGFLSRVAKRTAFSDGENTAVSAIALWEAANGMIDTRQFEPQRAVTASR